MKPPLKLIPGGGLPSSKSPFKIDPAPIIMNILEKNQLTKKHPYNKKQLAEASGMSADLLDLYGELTKLYGKRSGEWVFPNPETGKPFVDRRKQLKRICRVAEVNYLGFHAIRHSVASLLADVHKISLPTLQKILGHSRLTTTEKYVRSLGDGEREAAEFLTIPANSPANKNAIRSKCGGDEGI